MPRFNNGNSFGNAAGPDAANVPGGGRGLGLGKRRGRGQNCGGFGRNTNDAGAGYGFGTQRNAGFFRRFCLGMTEDPAATPDTRLDGLRAAIADLQRQIDTLKDSSEK